MLCTPQYNMFCIVFSVSAYVSLFDCSSGALYPLFVAVVVRFSVSTILATDVLRHGASRRTEVGAVGPGVRFKS